MDRCLSATVMVMMVWLCSADLSAVTTNSTANVVPPLFAMDPAVRRMSGTIEQKLDELKKLGYAGLSTNNANATDLKSVIAAAQSREMRVYALYMSCTLTTSGIELPADFDQICKILGDHRALLWLYIPSKVYKPSDTTADSIAVPALQAAADRAAMHAVKIAIYHHKDYWIEPFSDALRVAAKVDRPNLGVSFNLSHALYAGEENKIPELLNSAKDKLFMVTVNGADVGVAGAGWDRLIQPIGKGSYDLANLLKLFQEIGYNDSIGFQSFGIKDEVVEMLRTSSNYWIALEP